MKNFPKVSEIYTPNIDANIPRDYFENENIIKKIKNIYKLYRRFMLLCFTSQRKLLHQSIPLNVKRVLWINISSTSIGDSVMELSGRILLKDKYEIDLITDVKNVALYENDDVFKNIYTSPNRNIKYDFIILDILNTKSIKFKAKHFNGTPFVTLRGYWDSSNYGRDYNRMLFSYHRVNNLLANQNNNDYIDNIANNYLAKNNETIVKRNLIISIAIGGEDPIRTYKNMKSVVAYMAVNYPDARINLLGSKNGKISATEIMALNYSNVYNFVGVTTIQETRDLIAQSNFFIGVDGGLMHIAEAYKISGVVLFAKYLPKYRLGYNSNLKYIFTFEDINEISLENIKELLKETIEIKANKYSDLDNND
jgi:heptosyltransferase-2